MCPQYTNGLKRKTWSKEGEFRDVKGLRTLLPSQFEALGYKEELDFQVGSWLELPLMPSGDLAIIGNNDVIWTPAQVQEIVEVQEMYASYRVKFLNGSNEREVEIDLRFAGYNWRILSPLMKVSHHASCL